MYSDNIEELVMGFTLFISYFYSNRILFSILARYYLYLVDNVTIMYKAYKIL